MDLNTELFVGIATFAHTTPLLESVSIFLAGTLDKVLVIALACWWVWELVQHMVNHRVAVEARWLREGAFLVLSCFLTTWLVVLIKQVIAFPRPSEAFQVLVAPLIATSDAFSFPSAHAAIFAALALSTVYVSRKVGVFVAAGAVLISLGRVLVGVHTPIDILVGWVVGILVAVAVHSVFGDHIRNLFHKT